MNIESKLSGHWTDDQLIEHIYGLGPADGHLAECAHCKERLSVMQLRREAIELDSSQTDEIGMEFLAAQRRNIYANLSKQRTWWPSWQPRRWGSALATVLVLGGGLLIYEENQKHHSETSNISDVQLAQDVSKIAAGYEPAPAPTAPLEGLVDQ